MKIRKCWQWVLAVLLVIFVVLYAEYKYGFINPKEPTETPTPIDSTATPIDTIDQGGGGGGGVGEAPKDPQK